MQRAQATIEYVLGVLAITLLVAALPLALAAAGTRIDPRSLIPGLRQHAWLTGDERALRSPTLAPLIARALPSLVLERDEYGDDASVPTDVSCRALACAALGVATPVLYVHVVHAGAGPVVELWMYYPNSLTDHLPVAELRGDHADDWEGMLVAFDHAGRLLGTRVSAHVGFTGSRPWWDEARADWAPDPGTVFRASGSHALALVRSDVDLASDGLNGDLGTVPPEAFVLEPADRLELDGRRFDPAVSPPWLKAAWRDPDTARTGLPGDPPSLAARAARLWATLVGAERAVGGMLRGAGL
jgi:hypothetical protein